jgi:ABC-type bacteriocin/lantibiotic exporter with double-glycine peptidase domain
MNKGIIGYVLFAGICLWIALVALRGIFFHWRIEDPGGHRLIIPQGTENNCGPAALKVIFDHYNLPSTLDEITSHIRRTDKGASMFAMKEEAESKGLHAEGWRLTQEDLFKVHCPVILFVHGNHFIVVDSLSNDTLWICDPSHGKLMIRMEELAKSWKGETLLFTEERKQPPT